MKVVALIVSSSALCGAYSIPRSVVDGIYGISRTELGYEIHTRLSDPTAPAFGAPSVADDIPDIHKRQIPHDGMLTWCNCSTGMHPSETDAAVADLKQQLSSGQRFDYLSVYAIRGSVVAFACGGTVDPDVWASASTVGKTLAQVTKRCGRYVPGTGWLQPAKADGHRNPSYVGYMRWHKGLDFCRESRGPHGTFPDTCCKGENGDITGGPVLVSSQAWGGLGACA